MSAGHRKLEKRTCCFILDFQALHQLLQPSQVTPSLMAWQLADFRFAPHGMGVQIFELSRSDEAPGAKKLSVWLGYVCVQRDVLRLHQKHGEASQRKLG